MLTRPFGATGAQVSEIGFGCASWWAKPAFPQRDAIRLVHIAIEAGVTLFDTAASYGGGGAETRLGRALAGRDTSRLIVATKAGTDVRDGRVVRDFRPGAVSASVERSLKRLGLPILPLLQLHGPGREDLTDDLIATLLRLREQGRVRWLGVNSFDPAVAAHAAAMSAFDSVMIDYNILRPSRAPLIARAAADGKAVLAGMPLAMGHIGLGRAKIPRLRDLWYAARALRRHPRDVLAGARFGFLNRLEGWSGAQAALAHVLADRNVACAVVGATREKHLRELLATPGRALPAQVSARIVRTQAKLSVN